MKKLKKDLKSNIIYNSYYECFKSQFGVITPGTEITFRINIPKKLGKVIHVRFLVCEFECWEKSQHEYKTMEKSGENDTLYFYECNFLFDIPSRFAYCFEVEYFEEKSKQVVCKYYMCDNDTNEAKLSEELEGFHWMQNIREDTGHKTNVNEKIIYQIFPDRFCKGKLGYKYENVAKKYCILEKRNIVKKWDKLPDFLNENIGKDFYGGNFNGILTKLPYLEKLNVKVLYINPICISSTTHRYNTAVYTNIDPLLGSNKDFECLCSAAHKRGMIVILDGVFNHVGSDSMYFNKDNKFKCKGAYNSEDSIYTSWFPKINRSIEFGYKAWWDEFYDLAEVSKVSLDFQDFITGKGGVIDQWCSLGIDGLRLDVADELSDKFIRAIKRALKRNKKNCYLLGEVWENAMYKTNCATRKLRNYCIEDSLDGVMNYPFRDIVINYIKYGNLMYKNIMDIVEQYPKDILECSMNLVSSHDTERILTCYEGNDEMPKELWDKSIEVKRAWESKHQKIPIDNYNRGKKKEKITMLLMYYVPGMPAIYYGDEVGMCGSRDPFSRGTYPWGNEDEDLLNFYKKMGTIYENNNFVKGSKFEFEYEDKNIAIISRENENNKVIVAINRSEKVQNIEELTRELIKDYKTQELQLSLEESTINQLNPYGGWILKLKK